MRFVVYSINFRQLTRDCRFTLSRFKFINRIRVIEALNHVEGIVSDNIAIIQKCNSVHLALFIHSCFNQHIVDSNVLYLWSQSTDASLLEVKEKIDIRSGRSALRYLLECSSGLHSVTLGDQQVLSQIVKGILESERIQEPSKHLRLLRKLIKSSARYVRETTSIHRGHLSLERIACQLAAGLKFNPLSCSLLGLGQSGNLIAKILAEELGYTVYASNRNPERITRHRDRLGVVLKSFEDLSFITKHPLLIVALDLDLDARLLMAQRIDYLMARSTPYHLRAIIDMSNESLFDHSNPIRDIIKYFDISDLSKKAQEANISRAKEAAAAAAVIEQFCEHLLHKDLHAYRCFS